MSINMTIFVLTCLFLLVILNDSSGHEIEGCTPENPKAVDSTYNYFKCVGIKPDQHVSWNIKKMNHDTKKVRIILAAVCLLGKLCENRIQNVNAERNPKTDFAVLEIFKQSMSDVVSVGCTVFRPLQRHGPIDIHEYKCDVITRGLAASERHPQVLDNHLQAAKRKKDIGRKVKKVKRKYHGHVIEGCGPDNPMDVDISRNIFKCVGQNANKCVSWHFQKVDGLQRLAWACFYRNDQFSTFLSNVEARRYNDTSSILEVFSTDMSEFLSITCRVFDNPVTYFTRYMNDYTCNLTKRDLPTISCSLTRNADNSLSAGCGILNVYVLSRSYNCQFIARFEDDTTEVVRNSTFLLTEQRRGPATGACMAYDLPTTGNIKNVEVTLLPDNIHAIANIE